MTFDSWSSGIARPVMNIYPLSFFYFVPFVIFSTFVILNVLVGVVVNAVSKCVEAEIQPEPQDMVSLDSIDDLKKEIQSLKETLLSIISTEENNF